VTPSEHSLLAFLDAPVLVGDPDGCTVYVNPSFEERFETHQEEACGKPLAQLFEGGGREAMLRAVAEVCTEGVSVRFRLRERGRGFAALASPIFAQQRCVGVLFLLQEEVEAAERLLHLHRQLADSVEELTRLLEEPREGGRGTGLADDPRRALERVRQWSDALRRELSGRSEVRF
jgi:PAS domain-containing protein